MEEAAKEKEEGRRGGGSVPREIETNKRQQQ